MLRMLRRIRLLRMNLLNHGWRIRNLKRHQNKKVTGTRKPRVNQYKSHLLSSLRNRSHKLTLANQNAEKGKRRRNKMIRRNWTISWGSSAAKLISTQKARKTTIEGTNNTLLKTLKATHSSSRKRAIRSNKVISSPKRKKRRLRRTIRGLLRKRQKSSKFARHRRVWMKTQSQSRFRKRLSMTANKLLRSRSRISSQTTVTSLGIWSCLRLWLFSRSSLSRTSSRFTKQISCKLSMKNLSAARQTSFSLTLNRHLSRVIRP